ncbi:splicing factor 45 [Anopheles ziemanni]|uniref:splicing factor 45 n=1 Tax=Anopheles coustani TaxID=139045 RepID=UPI002658B78D|nr:splicing factor 45 [Anopheles coustani]XP_058172388.1 splicing factor 45 [Anopheles ziemanni]
MALYDDLDTKHGPDKVAGWSSGIKLLQTQLQVKKVNQPAITPKAIMRKPMAGKILTPVVLKARKEPSTEQSFVATVGNTNSGVDIPGSVSIETTIKQAKPITITTTNPIPNPISLAASDDYSWDVVDEYDPMWPNEYDKLVKDRKVKEPPIKPLQGNFGRNRREYKRSFGMRTNNTPTPGLGAAPEEEGPGAKKYSGFAGRPSSDDEEEFRPGQSRPTGAAIAPPPSLQESTGGPIPEGSKVSQLAAYGGSSVAAKIMAKYGFKDGQGLGKQEQGMAVALQVEKTSKRGGRIVHEKDIPLTVTPSSVAASATETAPNMSPPNAGQTQEPSITEIMKSPSKVVLLRNMVGPGDVDDELEPEVKDECNTKYGDVVTVIIHEVPNVVPEEAVRIFVEFKRMESAIKAVVDLNGRFFGGRQVRAGFYKQDRFENMDLGG